jgi:hypothetical protein
MFDRPVGRTLLGVVGASMGGPFGHPIRYEAVAATAAAVLLIVNLTARRSRGAGE